MPNTFSKFHTKSRQERLRLLAEQGFLDSNDIAMLEQAVHPDIVDLSEHFIENVIGCFPLPMGVVPNCLIDGISRTIPLAVEETSIVAALSKTAKWVCEHGTITTERLGHCIIGQVQCKGIADTQAFIAKVNRHKEAWIASVNQHVLASMVKRGGGLEGIEVRLIPDGDHTMAILHLHANTLDAMGANLITQACEHIKPLVQAATKAHVGLCIVSNLTDTMLTQAHIVLHNIDPDEGRGIAQASHFAMQDPYRACTHNKGVLNGIDPILIATGNDWRAVEAGIHAYAAQSGRYQSISQWHMDQDCLIGHFKAPLTVGTVGGLTRLHPMAQIAMKLLKVERAEDLARICAAVGLLQNLAALRALSGRGIVQGHMKLHIDNLVLASGAVDDEVKQLKQALLAHLKLHHKVTQSDAMALLQRMREPL